MSRPTGHANRDLWQLHEDVAFGRAGGQVIWQPRILAWFTDKYFEKEPLPTPYTHMAEPEIYVTFTEDELAACAEKVIALFAPKPILGASDEVEGYYYACGFSGHGFQHSPATGRLMADLILDGRTEGIDISPLNLARFRTGALLREDLTAHAGSMGD